MSVPLRRNTYGIEIKYLDKLGEPISNTEKIHYSYHGVDFLYKPTKNPMGLVVVFHGSVPRFSKLPVFRGYDFNVEGKSILCLSDAVIERYRNDDNKLELGWYSDTEKLKYFAIHVRIIKRIIKKVGSSNVLFFGSSGGGYMALKLAGYFKCKCLLANAQLYPEKYWYYPRYKEIIESHNDNINVDSIEEYIQEHKPKKIIHYCNLRDVHHHIDHHLPFDTFIRENTDIDIEFITFEGGEPPENKSHHHVQFPDGMNYKSLLSQL